VLGGMVSSLAMPGGKSILLCQAMGPLINPFLTIKYGKNVRKNMGMGKI